MRAGLRRTLFTLQAFDEYEEDSYGAKTPKWQDVCSVYGNMKTAGASETLLANALRSTSTALVTIPYIAGLTKEQNRLKLGDRVLSIKNIDDPDQRHKELVLTVSG